MLGGDGTILTALRRYAGREVPVFAVNFGAIGFLATVERDDLDEGLAAGAGGRLRRDADPGPRRLDLATASGSA